MSQHTPGPWESATPTERTTASTISFTPEAGRSNFASCRPRPTPPPATAKPDAETLVRENLHLARVAAGRYAKRHRDIDPDDAYSDALLGLWEAARRFDYSLAGFATYAERTMRCRMLDGTRDRTGVRTAHGKLVNHRRPHVPTISLFAQTIDGDRGPLTIADSLADPKARRACDQPEPAEESRLLKYLKPRHRRVLVACVVEGLTGSEVAAELGCSESNISLLYANAIRAARLANGAGDSPAPVRPRYARPTPTGSRKKDRTASGS